MDNKKYNISILQSETSDSVTQQLAKLFKISSAKAQQILQKKTFIVKKETDKKTAENFHKAISAIGINCRIDEVIDEAESTLPTIEEVQPTNKGKPLIDITRDDILPLHQEQANLSLLGSPVDNASNKTENVKVFDDINDANFCPECGTIRASADSTCVHCDYDPAVLKKAKMKSLLIKLTAFIVVIAIGIIISLPFYAQYTQRTQLEDDLKLAFDTRNTVTAFIQKTNFWPNQNIDAGLDDDISNRSIKSITVGKNAIITVVLKASVSNDAGNATGNDAEQTLIITPKKYKGRIVWNCLKGTLKKELRPEICLPHDN